MPLTLTVRSVERAGTAPPPPLRLERRGAVIGRAPGSDWILPDERNTVSSRHCEIGFRGGTYLIADTSTNGTWVNGRRLSAPHPLNDGDVLRIGPYEVGASLTADAAAPVPAPAGQAPRPDAGGAAEPLLRAAGIDRSQLNGSDAAILATAGTLLRDMTGGVQMLLERRARARKDLDCGPDLAAADNPLYQAGAALPRLLATVGGNAMPAERAVASAFADIEAHQLATLKAMQGAMQATLERFSPAAIRARAGSKGDAALWQEYERSFADGQAGFVEALAREYRQNYETLTRRKPAAGG